MKDNFRNIIHKPKIIIPIVAVIAVVIGVVSYGFVGRTPSVGNFSDPTNGNPSTVSNPGSVDLAFPKVGRVGVVNVSVGDSVKKGEVLASLEASDALGAVNQAKGALELAKAQYASLNVQYANVKRQQDVLVANAYKTLLSGGLAAKAVSKFSYVDTSQIDSSQIPTVSGTYNCDTEGSYTVMPYRSGSQSGYSFTVEGLEHGSGNVASYAPQPIGTCGLSIQFPAGYSSDQLNWLIEIPNPRASVYVANKNAYDLAVANRDQVLKQFEANLGQNGSSAANIAQAAVDSAEGAYQAALGAYQNNLIVAPIDGKVTFIDSHLKVGQSIVANKTVISLSNQ